MWNIISVEDFCLMADDSGWLAHFDAVVDDAVQVKPATLIDPPELGPALCRGSLRLGDDEWWGVMTAQKQLEFAQQVDEWTPISGD